MCQLRLWLREIVTHCWTPRPVPTFRTVRDIIRRYFSALRVPLLTVRAVCILVVPEGFEPPDILFRKQTLYPAELRIREMVPLAGFEPATYGLLNRCSTKWAKAALSLDAPRGLEPRLTESKSALLPLEDGAVSKQVYYICFVKHCQIFWMPD